MGALARTAQQATPRTRLLGSLVCPCASAWLAYQHCAAAEGPPHPTTATQRLLHTRRRLPATFSPAHHGIAPVLNIAPWQRPHCNIPRRLHCLLPYRPYRRYASDLIQYELETDVYNELIKVYGNEQHLEGGHAGAEEGAGGAAAAR